MSNAIHYAFQREAPRLEDYFRDKAKALREVIPSLLHREVRQLEDMFLDNGRGKAQTFVYNTSDGNFSLVPGQSAVGTMAPFGVLCGKAMSRDFGGEEDWEEMELPTNIRRLAKAFRENANGISHKFSYNPENGNIDLVPYNNATHEERSFGNICGSAMTHDFGWKKDRPRFAGSKGEHRGGFRERHLTRSFGTLLPHVFDSEFGGDISVASLNGDDLIFNEVSPMPGIAYTLEDEGVVRILRGRSDPHAKGKVDSALFVRGDASIPSTQRDVRYLIRIGDKAQVVVSERRPDGDHPIPTIMVIPAKEEHYGIGKGLMESPLLTDSRVVMFGCGSMGGDIAMHLAMAGVGNICLVDPDRVEASNLSRLRDAGIPDVGRRKVDVLAEHILGKNPGCKIDKVAKDLTTDPELMDSVLRDTDLVVVTTDNRTSRILIAQGLQRTEKPCIFARCSIRAESGDCFISRPGDACYECLYGGSGDVPDDEVDDFAAAKKAGRLAAYCTPEAMQDFAILPGISSDISAITAFASRLAMWELAKGHDDNPYIKVNEEFSQFNYFLFVTRREHYFKNEAWAPFDKSGQRPCAQRWYGGTISRRADCTCCGTRANELDTGEEEALRVEDIAQAVC